MDSLKTFCEFPSIGDRDYLTWHRDPRLARYLSGLEDRSLAQIANVLVNRICSTPTDKLACACITALLAHILFSTSGRARIRSQIFNPLEYHSTQIELADIYQIALDIISQPIQFLANFQPDPANWYGSIAVDEFDTRNPQPVHYDNLSARYIEQCERVELAMLQRSGSANDDRATLIQLVKYMGAVIRNYLQPQSDTLDRSIDRNNAQSKVLIDLIPDPSECHHQLESHIFKQDVIELSAKLAIDSDRLLMFFYGLELTQVEVGVELDCDQSTAKRRRDRCLKQLAKDLHAKIFQAEDLSIELLDTILDRLKLIYEDLYAELLLSIFELIVDDVNSIESSIGDLFVDRIERQWQFNFKPAQMGLAKATAFVTLRSPQVNQVSLSS